MKSVINALSIATSNATINAASIATSLALIAAAIDVPWLYANQAWSSKMIKDIQGSPIVLRVLPAIAIYVAIGFIISRAASPLEAAAIGAATYAIYDLTNYATLTKYDLTFAITDIIWGGVLFGLTALVADKTGVFRFRG